MTRIVVISDTHSHKLPPQVTKAFQEADFVIHAGDICDGISLEKLAELNEVRAVYGNMDEGSLREKLPRRLLFQCEGVTIGVFHGAGSPDGLVQRIQNEFKGEKVDVIIFGHSHQPLNEKIGDVLFLNPGSPNDKIFAPFCSYGMLEIDGNSVKAEIIKVE